MSKKPNKITIDDLAVMVQNGFSDMQERFNDQLNGIKTDIAEIKSDISDLKDGQGRLESELDGVKNILMNEVERHDRNEVRLENHEKRIIKLETA